MIGLHMEKIIFGRKGKIWLAKMNEDTKKWDRTDINELGKPISWYLPYHVEFDKKLTVKDLLTTLQKYEDHVNLIFAGYLQDATISDFINEMKLDPTDDTAKKIGYIEFFWHIDLVTLDDNELAEFRINQYPSFHGVFPDDGDPDETVITFEEYIDLSLISIRNYKNVPLILNSFAEYISVDNADDSLEASILDGTVAWTVFDMISSFLAEISLYGKPEEQSRVREEIKKDLEELENTQSIIESSDLFEYLESLDVPVKK